jgi:beta-lactamase regulating signal transducer with metallopeptidase domain
MSTRAYELLLDALASPAGALLLKSTAVLAAVLLVLRAARAAAASWRHLLPAAAFGVLLLLPAAAALVPWRVLMVAAPPRAASAALPAMAGAPVAPRATAPAAPSWRMPGAGQIALALYLAGAVALAASLLAALLRLRRMHATAEVSVPATQLAQSIAREGGLPGGIEVAVTERLAVPVTFGWPHPVILLPAQATAWDAAALARALRHELEHVARGDWATQLMARAALALYWPHPLAWALWRRLRLEAERACDDAVLRSQGEAASYAEQLVALARQAGAAAVPALSMATRGNLGLRVDAILDEHRRRAPRTRLASLLVGAAAVACALAVAPVRVVGAPARPAYDDLAPAPGRGPYSLDEALLNAAEGGDLDRMRRLMDKGASADAVIVGDGSPLIAAARGGHVEAMEMLIAAGASVNRGVNGDGNALTNAAREGHLEAVRLLLEKGADIDAGVPGDGNALIMAAGYGQLEVVRFLLDQGASLETVVPGDENALIHASEGGQADVVRLLIERGADVNARVRAGRSPESGGTEWRTALSMARRNNHDAVVRILLAAGARE